MFVVAPDIGICHTLTVPAPVVITDQSGAISVVTVPLAIVNVCGVELVAVTGKSTSTNWPFDMMLSEVLVAPPPPPPEETPGQFGISN